MRRIKGCFTSRVLKGILCLNFVLGGVAVGKAQDSARIKSIPFGDMDNWLVRVIEESFVIGGKTKTLHEIAPADTVRGTHRLPSLFTVTVDGPPMSWPT